MEPKFFEITPVGFGKVFINPFQIESLKDKGPLNEIRMISGNLFEVKIPLHRLMTEIKATYES